MRMEHISETTVLVLGVFQSLNITCNFRSMWPFSSSHLSDMNTWRFPSQNLFIVYSLFVLRCMCTISVLDLYFTPKLSTMRVKLIVLLLHVHIPVMSFISKYSCGKRCFTIIILDSFPFYIRPYILFQTSA